MAKQKDGADSKVQFVNNEPEQKEIRKSQNTLIVVGTGTILFGIWTAVKFLGLFIMLREETVAALKDKIGTVEGLSDRFIFWTIIGVSIIVTLFALAVRTYVGLSAISEGRGKRPKNIYLVFAIIMIINAVWTFCNSFFTVQAPEQLGALTRDQSISALIIEATSIIMMTQMVVSAFKIRKLAGAKKKSEGPTDAA